MKRGTIATALLLGLAVLAWSTGTRAADQDTEPNNSCSAPQNLGAAPLPLELNGRLGAAEAGRDVDFFRIVATPNSVLQITLQGAGSTPLTDPMLGAWTEGCGYLGNDYQFSQPARLVVWVPADGVVVIGATQYPDFGFFDGGVGSYRIDVAQFDTVKAIRGRLVDAVTMKPVGSSGSGLANVDLLRCDTQGCNYAGNQHADAEGRFAFTSNPYGGLLVPGQYKVIARADEYDQTETALFDVAADEDKDVGDIALKPFPIRISLVRPCAAIPASGGVCQFTVQVTDRLDERITGRVWSIVTGSFMSTRVFGTEFQTGVQAVNLNGLSSRTVQFSFGVPGNVSDNASFCVRTWFGEEHQAAYFNPLAVADLFCVAKMPSGNFQALSKKESLKLFRQLNGQQILNPRHK